MPRGGHTGVRVALAIPPGLHQQISDWAEAEGRPVASLCMSLIEQGIRDAQTNGLIPSPTETLKDFFVKKEEERQENERIQRSEFEKTPDEILGALPDDASPEEKKAALAAILSLMNGDGI